MKSWVAISLLLCTYGFLKELRPIDPFVTEYILEYKNVTAEEIIHVAFPISTYASLGSLVVFLLLTDLLRYKPIVCLEGICYVLTWGILTLFTGLSSVIVRHSLDLISTIVELFYGIGCSAEVAYSPYIYAQVDKKFYKKVTSNASSARLAGKFFGGIIAQILITSSLVNYHQLNYITVGCVCVAALCTFLLPPVKKNKEIIIKSKSTSPLSSPQKNDPLLTSRENENTEGSSVTRCPAIKSSLLTLTQDFKTAYGDVYVLKWSLWWAIASAGQYQVVNYVQALWEKIREDTGNEDPLFNGAVKATHTLLSALLSFGIGYTSIKWEAWGEATLTIISTVQGLMLIWMAQTNVLNLAYLSYVIFRTIHPVMITVASAEIAQRIPNDSYGLIFGINTFIALSLQTVLTVVVSDMNGLALDERNQYVVYGVCFVVLGLLIGGTSLCSFCAKIFCRNWDSSKESSNRGHSINSTVYTKQSGHDLENEKTDFVENNIDNQGKNEIKENVV